MSLLEDKVDSAVASHETAELAKRSIVEVSSVIVETQAHADEPPSTAASASDGMEEIDTEAPVPGPSHSREGELRYNASVCVQNHLIGVAEFANICLSQANVPILGGSVSG